MKNLIILFSLFATISLFAQEVLRVEYESKMLMDDMVIEDTMNELKEQAKEANINPEFTKMVFESMNEPTYYEMRLLADESEYKMIEKIINDQPSEGGTTLKVISGNEGTTYKKLSENKLIITQNGFGKDYLIKDTLKTYTWKILRESKEILGIEVRKAIADLEDGSTVEAWYAPKLPYKNGPDNFQGLPGLILEVIQTQKEKRGETKLIRKAISINADKGKSTIKEPTKGKTVTQKEYEEILKQETKRMREMFGGGVDKD